MKPPVSHHLYEEGLFRSLPLQAPPNSASWPSVSQRLPLSAHCLLVAYLVLAMNWFLPSISFADCIPDCAGKHCGPDGCGATCGSCTEALCFEGKCLEDCSLVPPAGCCSGDKLLRCVGNAPVLSDCDSMPHCGWSPFWSSYACGTEGLEEESGTHSKSCALDCSANCDAVECGPDGCGGSCGACVPGDTCMLGECCTPSCSGLECGPDGCGGSCGDCGVGQTCLDGMCCSPNCSGAVCGPDGCGGECGVCTSGTCAGGMCVEGCAGVPVVGCCHADKVYKCNGDQLLSLNCANNPECGWRSFPGTDIGFYDCGTEGQQDPSGSHSLACAFSCIPDCGMKQCGNDGCGGSCGTCMSDEICKDGDCCFPDCSEKVCGSDGCGGTCGFCPPDEQQECSGGKCVPAFGCATTSSPGCEGCKCLDCVCESYPSCCSSAWDAGCAFACEQLCGGCEPCVADCAGKACGSDGCGGSCGDCGAGFSCVAGGCCQQECEGIDCGPDGCGGDCGPCASGAACSEDGKCEQMWGCSSTSTPGCGGCSCESCTCKLDPYCCSAEWDDLCVDSCELACGGCGEKSCTPVCDGKECGTDGCDGNCGKCEDGSVCFEWHCCVPSCNGACGGDDGCGGSCGPPCEIGSYCFGGGCRSDCSQECDGLQCGEGLCGGLCTPTGGCQEPGYVCVGGSCYADCAGIPDQAGCCSGDAAYHCSCEYSDYFGKFQCQATEKECWAGQFPEQCGWKLEYVAGNETGLYACGGEPVSQFSDVGQCHFTCVGPICEGKECGPDGCGGVCGDCEDNERCVGDHCCSMDCSGKECGPDGCGGYCGECPVGYRCADSLQCEECEQPCAELECGPDGCGGYCGTCPEDLECVAGRCVANCAGIEATGCCWGDILFRCVGGEIAVTKCGPGANYCGWAPTNQRYECQTTGDEDPTGVAPKECSAACVPNCLGRECGTDGCGGACGECDESEPCVQGRCIPVPCEGAEIIAVEGTVDRPDAPDPEVVTDDSHTVGCFACSELQDCSMSTPECKAASDLSPTEGKTPGGCNASSPGGTPIAFRLFVVFLVMALLAQLRKRTVAPAEQTNADRNRLQGAD